VRTTLLALALLLVACGDRDGTSRPSAAGGAATLVQPGPDALVLRVARAGGVVRAYRYPALDSIVWKSTAPTPPLSRLLGFDAELGTLVGVTAAGAPLRVDLRLGRVDVATFGPVDDAATANGSTLFAVHGDEVSRFTPMGRDWTVRAAPETRVFPQDDGSVLVATPMDDGAMVRLLRPPATTVEDSGRVDAGVSVTATVGDRVYLGAGEDVRAVRARGVEAVASIGVGDSVIAAVATPSGDRVIVVAAETDRLAIIDRFEGKVSERVRLPGVARDVRMDPLGRVVLVRAASGDSVWVVSLADGSVTGTVTSAWRHDLPFVGADDRIALLSGADVVFVALTGLTEHTRVAGGADDVWFPMRWNGFRPRAAGLDQPVRFRAGTLRGDSVLDSAVVLSAAGDSGSAVLRDSAAASPTPTPELVVAPSSRFYVVLGSAGSAAEARDSAARVSVSGASGRVLSTRSAGGPVYLIVLGPYSSRTSADEMRRTMGPRAWVTEQRP
jgi:hypothetical protein